MLAAGQVQNSWLVVRWDESSHDDL